jgi:hypothetical protein
VRNEAFQKSKDDKALNGDFLKSNPDEVLNAEKKIIAMRQAFNIKNLTMKHLTLDCFMTQHYMSPC